MTTRRGRRRNWPPVRISCASRRTAAAHRAWLSARSIRTSPRGPIDKTALDALDGIFLAYEQAGGHDDAAILRPTSAVSIGDRETLVNVIRSTTALGGYLSSKYMFRDGGDTHIVTCEGDEESITALQTRIEALVGAIRVAHP